MNELDNYNMYRIGYLLIHNNDNNSIIIIDFFSFIGL